MHPWQHWRNRHPGNPFVLDCVLDVKWACPAKIWPGFKLLEWGFALENPPTHFREGRGVLTLNLGFFSRSRSHWTSATYIYSFRGCWTILQCQLFADTRTITSTLLQVRRSSYHDVVKVQDISKLADIGGVQSYVINGAKVLFLRRRPQPRPPKGAVGASQCTVCTRHLQDVSLYCSLQCKLDSHSGVKHVSLRTAAPRGTTSSSSGSGYVETPSHLEHLKPFDSGYGYSDSDSA